MATLPANPDFVTAWCRRDETGRSNRKNPKNAAAAEKKIADVLAQTVTAGNNGKNVDVYA